jgi:hypothetical protein
MEGNSNFIRGITKSGTVRQERFSKILIVEQFVPGR